MASHSPVGGSVIARVMACPGSVRAAADAPPQASSSSVYAEEGTMLHDVAAKVLDAWNAGNSLMPDAVEAIAQLDREQRDLVATYTRIVRDEHQALELTGEEVTLLVEERVAAPGLHGDMRGTADAVIYSPSAVRMIDLKCGRGVEVKVDYDGTPNPQLVYYLLCVLHRLGWWVTPEELVPPLWMAGCTDIEIIIVQPRRGGVKRRKVSLDELQTMARRMVSAILASQRDNAPREAGDHCRFCAARSVCPEIRRFAQQAAAEDFAEADDLTDEQLAHALRLAPLVESWARSVREVASARASTGHRLPGFRVQQRAGARRWADHEVARRWLEEQGLPSTSSKLPSPAEIERAMKKQGLEPDLLDDVTERADPILVFTPDNGSSAGAAEDFPEDLPADQKE